MSITYSDCDILLCFNLTKADWNRNQRLWAELEKWGCLPFGHPCYPAGAGGPGEGEGKVQPRKPGGGFRHCRDRAGDPQATRSRRYIQQRLLNSVDLYALHLEITHDFYDFKKGQRI